ncbi:MAG: DUF6261 family protein [Capnocytophaga sp.]|nr:DUF6261 family protein [Capnocytophaga sp.]
MSYKIDIALPGIGKLNNDEYSQFIKGILKLLHPLDKGSLGIKEELITKISTNLDLLTDASRQSRVSKESEEISRLDKERNNLVTYLLSSFKINKKSSLASHKEAAQFLSIEFKNYKGIVTLPYRQKSQAIDSIIKDLEKPLSTKYLHTLGVYHTVSSLKEINLKYQELVDVRAENQVNASMVNVKKIRKETESLYKELIRYAFSYHIINPTTENTTFISLFNKLVNDTMNAYIHRLSQLIPNKKENTSEVI